MVFQSCRSASSQKNRVKTGRNDDNIIRAGANPPSIAQLQEIYLSSHTERNAVEWCTLFNITISEFRRWRVQLRQHLRQKSGFKGTQSAYRMKNGEEFQYAEAGKEWMYWQLAAGVKNADWYISSGTLLTNIMADPIFKDFFDSTPGKVKEHPDHTRDGEDVRRAEPNFMLKVQNLKDWIAWVRTLPKYSIGGESEKLTIAI
jgi:hypothetical protein